MTPRPFERLARVVSVIIAYTSAEGLFSAPIKRGFGREVCRKGGRTGDVQAACLGGAG